MYRKIRKLFIKKWWKNIRLRLKKPTDVYFISGMCYSCSVFDNILLPKGFNKIYIEWEIPEIDESLDSYVKRMASTIDVKRNFILVGYSFGGIIIQEMDKILNPEKLIIISSMKGNKEIPTIFQVAKKMNFADSLPMRLYSTSNFMINLFNRYVYNIPTQAIAEYMTVVDPVYIRWTLRQITHWSQGGQRNLYKMYHIHGTRDQMFPYELIDNVIAVRGGDHLMVLKRSGQISSILQKILESKTASKDMVID